MSKLIKDSLSISAGFTAVAGTTMTITGTTMHDIVPGYSWWFYLLLLIALFLVCAALVYAALRASCMKGISLKVGSNAVSIVQGDLFEKDGWKVIPFNERFDTAVDDITIAKSSLNGVFITNYVSDLAALKEEINKAENTTLSTVRESDGTIRYDLGYIKRFEDEYLLLAFTHFDEQQRAHLSMSDYELCLMNMWRELSRTYAGKPINLPLLGSGITRFDDVPEKTFDDLLRCMICTLRATGETFDSVITIVLTKEAWKDVHPYELKGFAANGI